MAADIANVADGNVEVMLGQRHRSDDRPLIGCFMIPVVSSNTLQECAGKFKATDFLSVRNMVNQLGYGEHDIGNFSPPIEIVEHCLALRHQFPSVESDDTAGTFRTKSR
jgi:hypothetical protein